ncbi:calcium-binding protein, partial [Streptomyces wedmorensis]
GVTAAHGAGGDDLIDLGTDGGFFALGDHNINDPAGGPATGAGHDRILGGTGDELLVGDSSVGSTPVTAAGHDTLEGRGGADTLFGDNVNFDADTTVGSAGGHDVLRGGEADDRILAGPGNDRLDGGAATDHCDGQTGPFDSATQCETVVGVP